MRASFAAENQSVVLNAPLNFDAASSPNNLQQIEQYVWDFDASVDSNNDGDAINDVDAVGITASSSWATPGEKTVTLTVSGQLGFDRLQTNITVVDETNPVARITGTSSSSSATYIPGGWRIDYGETISLSCATSTDNHAIFGCSWSVDDTPFGQQTTASFNWSEIGTHDINLIVLDPSGNSVSTSVQILVIDPTVPSLDLPLLNEFTEQAIEGEPTTYLISASDGYDATTDLRFHWDLDPAEDSDGNGDALDDPDFIGSRVDLVFDKIGTNVVVVTVFDASNNSDSHTFSVIVSEAEVAETDFALFGIILLIGLLTMGVAMIGYRRWQSGIALKLLTDRGLPKNEAVNHLSMVKRTQRLPLFASAVQLAGLDSGTDVTSEQEKEQARKEAELQSIYGSSDEPTVVPQAQFAPSMQLSQASTQAANEAAALFFDDEPKASTAPPEDDDFAALLNSKAPEPQPSTKPSASGIELPQDLEQVTESPTIEEEPAADDEGVNLLKGTCSDCSLEFQVPMPIGVKEAIVICPSCSSEQLFQR